MDALVGFRQDLHTRIQQYGRTALRQRSEHATPTEPESPGTSIVDEVWRRRVITSVRIQVIVDTRDGECLCMAASGTGGTKMPETTRKNEHTRHAHRIHES